MGVNFTSLDPLWRRLKLFQKFICFGSLVRPLLEVAKHCDDVTIMVIMLTMMNMVNGWFFVYSGSSVVHYQPLSLFARARNTSGGDNHTTVNYEKHFSRLKTLVPSQSVGLLESFSEINSTIHNI